MDTLDEDAVREVEAFVERFNYFRKPYNERDKTGVGWLRNHGLAGDAVVYRAITGYGDIGLLMNRRPRFICFDVDVPGKGGDEPEPVGIEEDGEEEQQEQTVEQEEWDEEGPFTQDPRTWVGWPESGVYGEVEEGLERGLREAYRPVLPDWKFQHELEPETRRAVEALLECFNERPSLVVKSPHGAHLYWCLEDEALWYKLRTRLMKVKRAWEEKKRERGIERSLEILPTPERPLRVPRLDRLLEPDGLEPMRRPADGEAFWRGLRGYRLEGLIKDEVLERVWPKDERPGLRLHEEGEGGGEKKGLADAGIKGRRPRNSREAEELLMPFVNGETNGQLIGMVEGGKRGGMSLDDVTEWVLGWETRSRAAGYSGDMFRNGRELRSRIESLYAACNVTEAGATRFVRLWNEKEGKYLRNREAAELMLERLESVSPQPRQSRQAVLRFFENLEAWRRIIDDAIADPASGIDDLTRRNQGRGAYPLPSELIYEWYSGYDRIRAKVLASGLLVKDEQAGGGYVPDLGRPQYYQLGIPELRG